MYKLVMIALLCLIGFGCRETPTPPLRVGLNFWAGYAPLYLAQEQNYLNEDIKLVALPSASAVIHAMRMGTLEAAALTLDEALLLVAEGLPIKVILILDISAGADAILAKPDFQFPADLPNARIVVERSAVGALMLDAMLQKAQHDPKDIRIVDCQIQQHLQCFQHADLVVTYEPMKTKVRNLGGKEVFSSVDMPGQIVDVLVVLTSAEQEHKEKLKQLVKGYFQARQLMAQQTDLANTLMMPFLKLRAEEVAVSFQGLHLPSLTENQQALAGSPASFLLSAQVFADFLYARKLLTQQVTLQNFTSSKYLPEMLPDEN